MPLTSLIITKYLNAFGSVLLLDVFHSTHFLGVPEYRARLVCEVFVSSVDTFEMVLEDETGLKFLMPHHYESNVKTAGDVTNASRARRLAQEAVTLSTSLPLSASSSVFVRCDEERLDVMKVSVRSNIRI